MTTASNFLRLGRFAVALWPLTLSAACGDEERSGGGDESDTTLIGELPSPPPAPSPSPTGPPPSDRCPDGTEPGEPGPPWDPDNDSLSIWVETHPANARHSFDPLCPDPNPSRPVGRHGDGSLVGGLNLADAPEAGAYYHDPKSDPVDTDDWGALDLVSAIEGASRCWDEFQRGSGRGNEGPKFGVLDMSLRDGGPIPGHMSHQNGLDVDVRYVRNDGLETGLDIHAEPARFDLVASLELINCFLTAGSPIQFVLVDSAIWKSVDTEGRFARIRPATSHHHHHFHVRVALESGGSE